MNIKTADDELLITRTFDAPSAVLFALWSTPEHVKRWMGPTNFTCPEAEIDFRVGGTYRVIDHLTASMATTGSAASIARSSRIRRLVFTFTWDNDGPSAGVETLVTITFEEREERPSRPSIKDPS